MRQRPVLAGVVAGLAIGIGGAALIEAASEEGAAQRGAISAADLRGANQRASAAINGYKILNNRLGKFVAEPGELTGARSGPIPQDRGIGGGLPTDVLADGAITRPKLSPDLQAALDNVGPQGPQGPPGPPGTASSIEGIPAGGGLSGTYPNPGLASRSVGADQIDTPIAAHLVGAARAQVRHNRVWGLHLRSPASPRTFQTAAFFDPARAFVVTPPRAGFYSISASVSFDGDPDGVGLRRVAISRGGPGGSRVFGISSVAPGATPRTQDVVTGGSIILPAEAGQHFQVLARQTSGKRLGVRIQSLSIVYLGPPPRARPQPPVLDPAPPVATP